MKLSRILILLTTGWNLVSAGEEQPSVVRFANKDQLSGSMASLTPDQLVWKSPVLAKETPFFLRNVIDLKLTPVWPTIDSNYDAGVTLTNGDLIHGRLARISDDFVELDTPFAGRMKFHRVMISDVRINELKLILYQGPSSLDSWIQTGESPAWSFKDSSLRASGAGGIARDVGLPAECVLAFDLAWRGSFGFKVILFSDDMKKKDPPGGYSLTFQSRSVTLQNNRSQMIVGRPVMAVELQENQKAHVEIRASSKTGIVSLSLDGKTFPAWKDPDFAASSFGHGIHFITTNNSPVHISDIKVTAWDGVAENVPVQVAALGIRQFGGIDSQDDEKPNAEDPSENGRMLLKNGDSMKGIVTSIEKDMISIKTPFKDVRIPIERLKTVALKPVELERSKRENGDVRGWFPDGSSIVFKLDSVNDGILYGSNQNFGSASFKLKMFSRIEFNIYDPSFEDQRSISAW
jgi:hypothetical protein